MQLRGTGFFGKVPTAGDFQKSLLAEGPDGKTLEWFNDGWARYALAGQRPELQQPVHFVWQRPGAAAAFVGTMVASRDRSGRRFPLMVFAAVTGMASTADLLACCHGFFASAASVAGSGPAGVDVQALRGQVDSLHTAIDLDGIARQTEWQATTTAEAWAGGADGSLAARLRVLEYAFSGGGRPNFVMRGRWQGDLRNLTAGVNLLQRLGRQAPGMLFWTQDNEVVTWRVTYEYAVPSHFEALMWHDPHSGSAFDTDPGTVAIPASFVAREVSGAGAMDLGTFLASR